MPVAGDAQQGGACAAEAEACPGGAHQGLDFVIVGDQAFAVALVEPVLHGGAQQLFVSQLQRLQHQCAVGNVENGIPPADLLGKDAPGQAGGQIEFRDQRHKLPVRVQREVDTHRKTAVYHRGGEAAVEGRGQVIRVALHGVGDV